MKKKWMYAALSAILLGSMVVAMLCSKRSNSEDTLGNYSYGVSADHPEAVRIGMETLEKGGNAVDAAIAVSYALGVVEPFASGIGGGGLMVVYPNQKDRPPTVFDYKETAGAVPHLTKGIGVPGFVSGMEQAHARFGTQKLEHLIEPSIALCEEGFEIKELFTRRLTDATYRLNASQMPHLFPGGRPIQPGELLRQKELATTLKEIQKGGKSAFYSQKIARHLASVSPGLQVGDISRYTSIEAKPIHARVGDYEMLTVDSPGGGPMLIQYLLMAKDLMKNELLSADSLQTMGAIQGQIDVIRRKYIGDPRFVTVPTETIISKEFLSPLIQKIQSKVFDENKEDPVIEDDDNTTHFVIVDKNGMMVSCTNTLSNFFGSGVFVDGFFLNNKLTAFSGFRNSPNCYAPGKRSITFTAPTIFTKNGKPILGIGASGGSRITFMLSQVIIRHLFYKEPLQQAITQSRVFVKNNVVYTEKELSPHIKATLVNEGYHVEVKPAGVFYGGVQAIQVDQESSRLVGGYDFRRDGTFKGSE